MIRLEPKANWKQFNHPLFDDHYKWYHWGEVKACVSRDAGFWHLSISHPRRYPTWDEIYTAWYDLVPGAENITGAIILPRKAEYVNIHQNCFHVYQLSDTEIVGAASIVIPERKG